MAARELKVPDLGDFKDVPVIEILVKAGDSVQAEQALVVLESEKATMEVPAIEPGTIKQLKVRVGDRVSAGDVLAVIETAGAAEPPPKAAPSAKKEQSAPNLPEKQVSGGDLVVLGGGPGGYTAAFRAADLGQKVILVDRNPELGGVCLNVGCIPSKALLHAAKVIEDASEISKHGVKFGKLELNLDELRRFKSGVVGKLTGGLKGLAKRRKVEVIQGVGRFTGPNTLEVALADGKTRAIPFSQAIIAAGSEPVMLPGLPEDPRIMDSTGALELPEVPARLLVIGGGIIGLEMANVYAALGSAVDVVEMTPGLLPGTDPDLVKPLHKRMKERLAAIYTGTKVIAVATAKDGLKVKLEGKDAPAEKTYDRILVAVGRRPNGKTLNAEAAGVKVDERGYIPTDAQQRTNVAHIFAIGDVTKPPLLAHKATHEAKVAAEVAAGHKSAFDARCIPSVVYTDPEVAWTGLTEQDAKEKRVDIGVGRFPWAANGRSLGIGYTDGFTKLLFDKGTGRLLGGAAVGPNAGELMAEISLAIEMGADAQDIGLTIHAHPTLSETVAMSAEQIAGTLTDL